MGKLVAGVGVNDADYRTVILGDPDENGRRKPIFKCPYYSRWYSMLTRCFNKGKSKYKQYEKTTVCEEWLTFSNFKRWMEGCDRAMLYYKTIEDAICARNEKVIAVGI